MQQDDPRESPLAASPLSYQSSGVGKRYQRILVEAGKPIYFPKQCCDCLKVTEHRHTIVGNRLRGFGAGAIISGTVGEPSHFQLKIPVCTRCWNAYQRRRRSWFWLGPLVGVGLLLAAFSPLMLTAFRAGQLREIFCAILCLGVFGATCGFLMNSKLSILFASPPVKIHLHTWAAAVSIRFRNAEYIEEFDRAQIEAPAAVEANLQQLDAPTPVGWYYLEEDEPVGPVSFDVLRQRVADGLLCPEDQVWAEDQPDWMAAEAAPGLFS